jgi:2-keto-4-pentenoate hydratase/2-oxohepta-3-ene-1,7-dioic acid hydratase in catechol pathway
MRIIRFKNKNNEVQFGWVIQEKVGLIQGDPFGEYRRFETSMLLSELELLLPCQPSKIIAVGRNYAEHAAEMNNELPAYPLIFMKPPSALITNGEPILLPGQSSRVEHEAELAIVVGKEAKNLNQNNVREAIFGYTIANDVTARDLQKIDGQWTRAKGFDTFCPLGPWIDTEFDPSDAMISCHVNHALRQMGSTKDMTFNPAQLMIYISSIMTLMPGDLILTGTPAGVGPLVDGDLVTVQIDGLGTLVNPVKKAG